MGLDCALLVPEDVTGVTIESVAELVCELPLVSPTLALVVVACRRLASFLDKVPKRLPMLCFILSMLRRRGTAFCSVPLFLSFDSAMVCIPLEALDDVDWMRFKSLDDGSTTGLSIPFSWDICLRDDCGS